jgi:hypothetical protein
VSAVGAQTSCVANQRRDFRCRGEGDHDRSSAPRGGLDGLLQGRRRRGGSDRNHRRDSVLCCARFSHVFNAPRADGRPGRLRSAATQAARGPSAVSDGFSSDYTTCSTRIISWSSWDRMWQCQT